MPANSGASTNETDPDYDPRILAAGLTDQSGDSGLDVDRYVMDGISKTGVPRASVARRTGPNIYAPGADVGSIEPMREYDRSSSSTAKTSAFARADKTDRGDTKLLASSFVSRPFSYGRCPTDYDDEMDDFFSVKRAKGTIMPDWNPQDPIFRCTVAPVISVLVAEKPVVPDVVIKSIVSPADTQHRAPPAWLNGMAASLKEDFEGAIRPEVGVPNSHLFENFISRSGGNIRPLGDNKELPILNDSVVLSATVSRYKAAVSAATDAFHHGGFVCRASSPHSCSTEFWVVSLIDDLDFNLQYLWNDDKQIADHLSRTIQARLSMIRSFRRITKLGPAMAFLHPMYTNGHWVEHQVRLSVLFALTVDEGHGKPEVSIHLGHESKAEKLFGFMTKFFRLRFALPDEQGLVRPQPKAMCLHSVVRFNCELDSCIWCKQSCRSADPQDEIPFIGNSRSPHSPSNQYSIDDEQHMDYGPQLTYAENDDPYADVEVLSRVDLDPVNHLYNELDDIKTSFDARVINVAEALERVTALFFRMKKMVAEGMIAPPSDDPYQYPPDSGNKVLGKRRNVEAAPIEEFHHEFKTFEQELVQKRDAAAVLAARRSAQTGYRVGGGGGGGGGPEHPRDQQYRSVYRIDKGKSPMIEDMDSGDDDVADEQNYDY